MDETALAQIEADPTLTDEAKALVVSAAELDVTATHEELKTEGIITYENLVARMQADFPDAKTSDVEQAVIAVWIF
jgi:hypothetical protein